jgi:hypothetical protein
MRHRAGWEESRRRQGQVEEVVGKPSSQPTVQQNLGGCTEGTTVLQLVNHYCTCQSLQIFHRH